MAQELGGLKADERLEELFFAARSRARDPFTCSLWAYGKRQPARQTSCRQLEETFLLGTECHLSSPALSILERGNSDR